MSSTATALIIGNEILSGRTQDRNGPWLARELRRLGARLERILVVPDDLDAISDAIRSLAPLADGLITSGGVGPTHDDVTMQAVAQALGRSLQRHPELERLIRELIDPDPPPSTLRMAEIPEGSALLWGPGLRVPVIAVETVYVLPGLPKLFRRKFRALRERFRDTPYCSAELLLSQDETHVAELISVVAMRHPRVGIGSYPRTGRERHLVRVSVESKSQRALDAALEELQRGLPAGVLLELIRG